MFPAILRRALTLVLILFTTSVTADDFIGKIILAQGQPIVERANQHLLVKRNDKVYQLDKLITPVGSRVLIRFRDKTTLSLAENTAFEFSRYEFGDTRSEVNFKMLKGAFRALTGAIGKQKDPKFEIHTPLATIGVRGTEFWGGMIFSDALDVTMLEGKGVYIRNQLGEVEITQAGDGTVVSPGKAPADISRWSEEKLKKAMAATHLKGSEPESSNLSDY